MKKEFILVALLLLGVLAGSIATSAFAQDSGELTRDYGIPPMPSPDPPIVKLPGDHSGKLYVAGESTLSVDPDQAELLLGVFAEAYSAASAQKEVSTKMAAVKKALKREGVPTGDIETTRYDVSPQYDWNNGKRTLRGYRVTHDLKVKTQEIDGVGILIDAAIAAGANDINGVQFTLQDATRAALRTEALQGSTKYAQAKARALATGFGVKLGMPIEIQEGVQFMAPPMPYLARSGMMAEDTMVPTTEISPGQVRVTARVSVTYTYEA